MRNKIDKKNGLVVLSLFDGMSCGRLALEKSGIKVDKYLASEIKPFAINHTKVRYPATISIGDVTKVHYDKATKTLYANCEKDIVADATLLSDIEIDEYKNNGCDVLLNGDIVKWKLSNEVMYQGDIDLLIGGSPCQNFSMANSFQNSHQYGLKGEKSRLFYEYARIKNEVNPTYFFLENVKMQKKSEDTLNNFMGVNGLHINSNTISVQHRDRIYWTNIRDFNNTKDSDDLTINNIPIPTPKKGVETDFQKIMIRTLPRIEVLLRDIKFNRPDIKTIDDINNVLNLTTQEIDDIRNMNDWAYDELEAARIFRKKNRNIVAYDKIKDAHPYSNKDFVDQIHLILMESLVKKTPSRDKMWNGGTKSQYACKNITRESKMSCLTRKQDRFPNSGLIEFGGYCRFVNRLEICKGQTVPYKFLYDLSYANIQDVCGDGWTVDVISHIFNYLNQVYVF